MIRGGSAVIVCNECRAVVRTVAIGDLRRTLHEMELTLDLTGGDVPALRQGERLSGVFADGDVYV
jgi:hypothetical protein